MTAAANNPLRQAAVLIRSLAPDAAAAMLGRLSVDEATALRAAIKELGDFDEDEKLLVVEQLRQPETTPSTSRVSTDGAVELQLGTTEPEPLKAATPTVPPAKVVPPPIDGAAYLGSLGDADPESISSYLDSEQPRAVALVLGHLPPQVAAGVLRGLPNNQRAEVVVQLADQGDADPDSLRVIAKGLSDWVDRRRSEQLRRESRVATIRQILAATPADEREEILRGLAKTEPEIAAALGVSRIAAPKPETGPVAAPPAPALAAIPFDQLHRLDSRGLAEAVGRLAPRTALLALAGAPEELLNKLVKGLSRTAASDLRARLLRVGPTTLAEIDRAQQTLGGAAAAITADRRLRRTTQAVGA